MRTYLVRYKDSSTFGNDVVVTTFQKEEDALEKVVDLMLDKDFQVVNILELKFNSYYPSNTPSITPMEIDITGSHFALKYLPVEDK